MKRNDLFKAIGICFLIFIILSWIIPTGSYNNGEFVKGAISAVGLTDLFYYPVITFGTFVQYGLLFLILGGFYGVINKTGVYKKWIDAIVKSFKGKEKLFLILTIIILSLLTAVTGIQLAFFAIIPLLIAVIISMGYNKIVAFTATIGALLVGNIGALYGVNVGHINYILGLSIHNNILAKIVLLALLTFLLVMFVLRKSVSKVEDQKDAEEEIPLLDSSEKSKKSFAPLAVIIGIVVILLLVSMYSWNYNLGITVFDDVYQSIMNIKIGQYPLFKNLIGDISPLGYWDTYEMCCVLIVASLLIGWIYSIKLKDIISSFVEGAKKMLKVAFFVTLANIIFALMIAGSNSTILNTINNSIFSLSNKFNLGIASLLSLVGSLFYNNFYYLSNVTLTTAKTIYTDATVYGVFGLLFQSLYSLMMMILPTSLVMIAGLSMMNISWKDWFKYIWKYLIQALVIILIVSIIVFMFI